jgi:peptidoglycan/LPS O-acetylase OafA/YrhL
MFVLILVVSILAAGNAFDPAGTVISLSYMTNLVLGYHWPVDSVPRPLGPLWSLATEDQFYLLWPVVLFLVLRGRQRAGAIVALAVAVLMTLRMLTVNGPEHRLLFSPDTRPVGLAIGCLAAFAYAARAEVFQRLRMIGPVALCICLLLVVENLDGWLFRGMLTIFGLLAAVTIVSLVDGEGVLGRLLSLPLIVYVGRTSYSLYLWHLPVLLAFGCVFDQPASTARRWVAVATCFAVAAASYHLVEEPFRRRRKRVTVTPLGAEAAG